jgi:hypothetical protein
MVDLLTRAELELLRKDQIEMLANVIESSMNDVRETGEAVGVWQKRIAKEAWLPSAVLAYLKTFKDQCFRARNNLHSYLRVLNVYKTNPSSIVKNVFDPIKFVRDAEDAQRMIRFYQTTLEPFLYERSDPMKRGQSFTLEALILFIDSLYKHLELSGIPMPLFSHAPISTEIIHEAYRLPLYMEFGVDKWSLCAHEVGHKVFEGLSKTLLIEAESAIKTNILESVAKAQQDQVQESWRKIDLKMQVEEMASDIFATMLMGPAYFLSSLGELRTNSFSQMHSSAKEDQTARFTHPPLELRFMVMLYVLEELGYRSNTKLWGSFIAETKSWRPCFDILLKLAANPANDLFGGFFGGLFESKASLRKKILERIPQLKKSTLDLETFQELPSKLEAALSPIIEMDSFYVYPQEIPSALDIVRGVPTFIARYSDFRETVRLRAIRLLELKYILSSSNKV